MKGSQTRKVIDAFEAVGIKKYVFSTDMNTHYYNNDNAIIKYVDEDEMIYNIRANTRGGSQKTSEGNFEIAGAWCEDIHEVVAGVNYDQIDSLISELGMTLSDSDTKLILNINSHNYDIIPMTGDYVNAFHYLSKKEIEELSPEEKTEYEAKLKAYEDAKAKHLGEKQAASITVG